VTADEKLAYIEVVLASNLIDSSKLLAIEECLAGGDTWVLPGQNYAQNRLA
jgi:hypothetical protein